MLQLYLSVHSFIMQARSPKHGQMETNEVEQVLWENGRQWVYTEVERCSATRTSYSIFQFNSLLIWQITPENQH